MPSDIELSHGTQACAVSRQTFMDTVFAGAAGKAVLCEVYVPGQYLDAEGRLPTDADGNPEVPSGQDRYPATFYNRRARRALDQATHACIGALGDALNERGRPYRSPTNVVDLTAIQIDDVGSKNGQTTEALPVEPSIIIETRPNNATWLYLLDRPITPDQYRAITESLKAAGYGDANCTDPQRLFRLPGSKPVTKAHQAELILWRPDRRFNPDTFLSNMQVAEVEISPHSDVPPIPAPPGVVVHDAVLDWLREMGRIQGEDTGGFYRIDCPWADQYHSDHRDTAKYKPATEVDTRRIFYCHHSHGQQHGDWGDPHRIEAFLEWVADSGGPQAQPIEETRTLALLAQAIGATPETAAENPTRQAQATHEEVETDNPPMTLSRMLERYVWFKPDGRIIDLGPGPDLPADYPLMTERGVVGAHPETLEATTPAGNPTRISIVKAWIAERHKLVTDCIPMLDPRKAPGYSDGIVNTYRPFEAVATDESPDPFLRLVQHVAPDDAEYLLDWIAYKIQRPWERMVAVVSYTPQFGTGRNALFHIVRLLLGESNCAHMTASRLFGEKQDKFNGHLMNLMVTMGEVDEGDASADRRVSDRVFNRLKEMVDPNERTALIERKGVEGTTAEIFTSFMIATNAGGGMPLEEGDRRFSVLRGSDTPLLTAEPDLAAPNGWLHRVRDMHDRPALSAVWHMLRARDVSQFNPNVVRNTHAKAAMIHDRKNEIDLAIEEELDGWPVFTVQKLFDLVRARTDIMLNYDHKDVRRQVGAWARKNSSVPVWVDNANSQIKVGGRTVRPRVRAGHSEGNGREQQRAILEKFMARVPMVGGENVTTLRKRDEE